MFCLIQFDSIQLSTYFITSNYQNHNDYTINYIVKLSQNYSLNIYVMLLDLYIYLYMYICQYVYKYIYIYI